MKKTKRKVSIALDIFHFNFFFFHKLNFNSIKKKRKTTTISAPNTILPPPSNTNKHHHLHLTTSPSNAYTVTNIVIRYKKPRNKVCECVPFTAIKHRVVCLTASERCRQVVKISSHKDFDPITYLSTVDTLGLRPTIKAQ